MSIFNSNGKKINNDDKNNRVNTPANESTYLEFSVVNDNHLRHSAAPNTSNIDDDSDVTIQNLNTNSSQGGNNGKNN